MARNAAPPIVDVHCTKCDRYIVSAIVGSDVKCPKCQKWYTAKEKSINESS